MASDNDAPETAHSALFRSIPGMLYRGLNQPGWPVEVASDGCLELCGYTRAELENGEVSWGDIIEPRDRERVWLATQDAVANDAPYEFEYRIRTRTGEQRWVWERGQAGTLAADGLVRLEGLVTDIIACPGLDYCALATARSIPVAQRISERFADLERQEDLGELKIKISGCINACGHHHVGHIGILGVDKKGEEFYQVTLGGSANENASSGEIVGRGFSSEEVVDAIEKLVDTTGAGDLYAAGFLFGYTSGRALDDCGRLGSLAAGLVIQQIGPRPRIDLRVAAQQARLL